MYSVWLSTAINTRHKIAAIFKIPKTGATHVVDNRIDNDGYNVKDIEEKLNKEALQKYLVTDEQDMAKLFSMLVDCVENPIIKYPTEFSDTKLEPLPNPVIPVEVVPIIEAHIKKKLGRPAKVQ
jgi:hypothetical protein